MGKKRVRKLKGSHRLRIPEEARLPWLTILLEVHAITAAGIAEAVRRRDARPACRPGCTVCCRTQSDIAVFPLELAGLSWYCTERLSGPVRETVTSQLSAHRRGGSCPFLVGGACAVYEMRPMACRQFTVFGAPCGEGEDPWHTRREDVLIPAREALDRAYRAMLPFHEITVREEQNQALARGVVRGLARNLPDLEWQGLVRMMEAFAARHGRGSEEPAVKPGI